MAACLFLKPRDVLLTIIIPTSTLSSFVLYLLHHSVIWLLLLSPCCYSLIPVSLLWFLAFAPQSISSLLKPPALLSVVKPLSEPLAVRNLTAWQKETKPRKRYSRFQPKVMWGELRTLSSVSVRDRANAADWQQTPSEHLCCKNMH